MSVVENQRPVGVRVPARLVDVLATDHSVATVYVNLDAPEEMFILFDRPGTPTDKIGQVGTLTLVRGNGLNIWTFQANPPESDPAAAPPASPEHPSP